MNANENSIELIKFSSLVLDNGLRVLIHEDRSTPMVVVNVLYEVGSKHESPGKTGFAHLFEHLMFGGSANVPDFDTPVQQAGGDSNAFTNCDVTEFYEVLPAQNLEVALWLESDRMLHLNISEKVLRVQKKVVIEEFKETCFNEPYGDLWHLLSELAYTVHPYRWPTIGKVPDHVAKAAIGDVSAFFAKYYRPNNAILTIAGNVRSSRVKELVKRWFGDIPPGPAPTYRKAIEPPQQAMRAHVVKDGKVPLDAIYLAFHVGGRNDPEYYAADLLSDVLANGPSSRLFRRLLKERELFSSIDCYLTGSFEPGLLIIEGKPSEGISPDVAEKAIWEELEQLRQERIPEPELQKLKNKTESSLLFAEINVLTKATNLAFFEALGDANRINEEIQRYRSVSTENLREMAKKILVAENCSRVVYEAAKVSMSAEATIACPLFP